jgi:hypothetical protein
MPCPSRSGRRHRQYGLWSVPELMHQRQANSIKLWLILIMILVIVGALVLAWLVTNTPAADHEEGPLHPTDVLASDAVPQLITLDPLISSADELQATGTTTPLEVRSSSSPTAVGPKYSRVLIVPCEDYVPDTMPICLVLQEPTGPSLITHRVLSHEPINVPYSMGEWAVSVFSDGYCRGGPVYFELVADGLTEVRVPLLRSPVVAGTVSWDSGEPIPFASVALYDQSSGGALDSSVPCIDNRRTTSGSDGKFECIAPCTEVAGYSVRVGVAGDLEICGEVDTSLQPISIVLTRRNALGSSIDGCVVFRASGRPVQGATVHLLRGEGKDGRVIREESSGDDGKFIFANLKDQFSRYYVRAIHVDGECLSGPILAGRSGITLTISKRVSVVLSVSVNEKPWANGQVLIRDSHGAEPSGSFAPLWIGQTDADGLLTVTGLPRATYWVFVSSSAGETMGPECIDLTDVLGEVVHINIHSYNESRLGSICVEVVPEFEEPARGEQWLLEGWRLVGGTVEEGAPPAIERAMAGVAGSIEVIKDVRPGDYWLRVTREGDVMEVGRVVVPPGGVSFFDVLGTRR